MNGHDCVRCGDTDHCACYHDAYCTCGSKDHRNCGPHPAVDVCVEHGDHCQFCQDAISKDDADGFEFGELLDAATVARLRALYQP